MTHGTHTSGGCCCLPVQASHDGLHRRVASVLAEANQRYTRLRRSIVAALAEARAPLAVGELTGRLCSLPLSSAYRNMRLFVALDIVSELAANGDHARFELSEGITGRHTHHARCRSCGSIVSAPAPATLEEVLEWASSQLDTVGFHVEQHHLEFLGTCNSCHEAESPSGSVSTSPAHSPGNPDKPQL